MKRVLALLVAVGLVVGAVALRNALDGVDDPATPGGDEEVDGNDGSLVVGCVPELLEACREAVRADEVVALAPGDAVDGLAGIDAWVTFDPWPAVLRFEDGADERFLEQEYRVASIPLTMVVRDGVLDGACADSPDWDCAVAGARGRATVPAIDTTLGPLLLGWAVVSWNAAARPGEPFATAEFELAEFQRWLGGLDLDLDDPLREALVLGQTGPAVIGTTAADAARIEGSREAGRLRTHPGATPGSLAVVVAGPAAERVGGDPTFQLVLESQGFTIGEQPSAGLPTPGLLFALIQEAS